MTIRVLIQGTPTLALLDSGSPVSLLNLDFSRRIGVTLDRSSPISLKGFQSAGSTSVAYPLPNVVITIHGQEFTQDMLVDALRDDCILGMDFLKQYGAHIDFGASQLRIGELIVSAVLPPTVASVYQVHLPTPRPLPSQSHTVLIVPVDGTLSGNTVVFSPSPHTDLWFAHGVSPIESGSLRVAVINPTLHPIVLPTGTSLGTMELLPDLPDFPSIKAHCPFPVFHDPHPSESEDDEDISMLISPSAPRSLFPTYWDCPSSSALEFLRSNTIVEDGLDTSLPYGFVYINTVSEDTIPAHVEDLWNRSLEHLTPPQSRDLASLLTEFSDVFSTSDTDLGCYTEVKHSINTGDARPIRQRLRRTPLGFEGEEDKHLQQMLECGVIRPSTSEWASPSVLVRKKCGGLRWCIDFRALNAVTQKDAYPLPLIDECLDALSGVEFMSSLDMSSGYWQLAMEEKDIPKTAFLTKQGLFEFTRMPFGLSCAPASFVRCVQNIFRGMNWKQILTYLDDLLVLGNTFPAHLANLRLTLLRLRQANMKLKARKCHLFQREVKFLGKIVNQQGVAINPGNIKVILDWPLPTSVKQVQSFLGLANYHREHISHFAEIAAPLYSLTSVKAPFAWEEPHTNAMRQLQAKMTSTPVLAYPNHTDMFILDTDASDLAIGAELLQVQDGKERVISYGSYALTPTQRKYCTTRKELLAVVRFTRQYRHYLLGRTFCVRTDHSSLAWLMRFRHIEGQLARWLEELSQYDLTIQHRQGKHHANADGLSRRPIQEEQCDCYMAGASLDTLPCGGCPYCQRMHHTWSRFEDTVDNVVPLTVRAVSQELPTQGQPWLPGRDRQELAQLQEQDPDIGPICPHFIAPDNPPLEGPELDLASPATKHYWQSKSELRVLGGLLYYLWIEPHGTQSLFILPTSLHAEVLRGCHDDPLGGHLGTHKTLAKVRQHYYWYQMRKDVDLYVQACDVCSRAKKASRHRRAPLGQYRVGSVMERVHIDILGPLPLSPSGNRYILLLVDQFSKWIEVCPLPDQRTESVAQAALDSLFSRFGCPREIHSDQGRNFESNLFASLCDLLQIVKTRTTPYHPSSNGQVERYNRLILQLIRCYLRENKHDWDTDLQLISGAIRSMVNRSTGFTANMLMLGREVQQPVDLLLGPSHPPQPLPSPPDYVQRLKASLAKVHLLAREQLGTTQKYQRRLYDKRLNHHIYEEGDVVYRLNEASKVGESNKLKPVWVGPLLVTKKLSDILYRVQSRKRSTVLHHDKLKQCHSSLFPRWLQVARRPLLSQDPGPIEEEEDNVLVPPDLFGDNSLPNNAASDIVSEVPLCPPALAQPPCSLPVDPAPGLPQTRAGRTRQLPPHLSDFVL